MPIGSRLLAGIAAAAMMAVVAGTPAPSPSYITTHTDTTDKTAGQNWTFAAASLGTAHAKRVIVLGVYTAGLAADAAVTVAGNAATFLTREATSGFQMHYIALPTGATGNIVVTVTGSSTRVAVSVWAIYPHDPVPWKSANVVAATTTNGIIAGLGVAKKGHLLYFGGEGAALGTFTTTWDGVGTLTEDFDGQLEAASSITAGHMWGSTSYEDAPRTIDMAESTSGTKALNVGIWGPETPSTLSFTYNTKPADVAGASPVTFTSADLGAAAADRVVVVNIHGRWTATPTFGGCTIAGVTASLIASQLNTEAGVVQVCALVPSGTSGNIVVTWTGGTISATGISTYSIYNAEGHFPASFVNQTGSSTTAVVVTLVGLAGGLALYGLSDDESTVTHSWSAANERYDTAITGFTSSQAAAEKSLVASGSFTETVTPSASSNRRHVSSIWR